MVHISPHSFISIQHRGNSIINHRTSPLTTHRTADLILIKIFEEVFKLKGVDSKLKEEDSKIREEVSQLNEDTLKVQRWLSGRISWF